MLNKLLFSEDKSHLGGCTREDPTEREQRHYRVCRTYYTDSPRQEFSLFPGFFPALQLLLLYLRRCLLLSDSSVLILKRVSINSCIFDTEKSLNKQLYLKLKNIQYQVIYYPSTSASFNSTHFYNNQKALASLAPTMIWKDQF